MRRFAILLAVLLWPHSASAQHYYSTNFPLTETPISEGGKWVNGGSCNNSSLCAGLDWTNINTTAKVKAYGTTPSTNPEYDDSTAVLQSIGYTWGPNQGASGVVYINNPGNAYDPEVEIRLNTTVAAHNITGYECTFSIRQDSVRYAGFGTWNGALGQFTNLTQATTGGFPALKNGDVVACDHNSVAGTVTMMLNGTVIASGSDHDSSGHGPFTGGAPGLGTDTDGKGPSPGGGKPNGLFGFSSFQATDTVANTRRSGANYTYPRNPARALVTLAFLGITKCLFFSADGSDSSDGSSEVTNWLHAPKMPNCSTNCAALSPLPASTGLIVRGGDSWHMGIATDSNCPGASCQPSTEGKWEWNTPEATSVARLLTQCMSAGI